MVLTFRDLNGWYFGPAEVTLINGRTLVRVLGCFKHDMFETVAFSQIPRLTGMKVAIVKLLRVATAPFLAPG